MSQIVPDESEVLIDDVVEDFEGEETAVSVSMTLPELQAFFERQLLSVEQVQETAVAYAEKLLTAVKEGDVAVAQTEVSHLQGALVAWRKDADELQGKAETAAGLLDDELTLRPDLSLTGFQGNWLSESVIIDEIMLLEAPELVAEILTYDRKREAKQAELDTALAKIITVQQALAIWQSDDNESFPVPSVDEEIPQTLTEVTKALTDAQNLLTRVEGRLTQLRSMSLNVIQRGAGRLVELGEPESAEIIAHVTLNDIQNKAQSDWSDKMLFSLEREIQTKINQYMMDRKSTDAVRLAQQLLTQWDDSVLVELLEALAESGDDVQAVLLLLSANNVHPRDANIHFSGEVVLSLIRGVGRLSQRAKPFYLLNLLSSSLLSGWETDDQVGKTELCLVFTAAYFCGKFKLPSGILWQISADWPLEKTMPNWQILWHSLLLADEPVTIVTDADKETTPEEILDLARQKVHDTLSVQDGRFLKVKSIKSDRHSRMLNTYLLPKLVEVQTKLSHFEKQWQAAEPYQKSELMRQLNMWILQGGNARLPLEEMLSEDHMTELYQKGVADFEIRDNKVFHKKSSLTLAVHAGEDVLNYAQALLATWEEAQQDVSHVAQADLAREIEAMSPKTRVGQIALNEIVQVQGVHSITREADIVERQSYSMLTQELITNDAHALSMPRLVGYLAGHSFSLQEILPYLLEDIAKPVSAEEAAKLLLNVQAPRQAILLVKYVDLEMQKQSQQMQQEMQKKIESLETAVLKLNGRPERGLKKAKELGCYLFVIDSLKLQQDELQMEQAEHAQGLKVQSHKLRQSINELDNYLFKIQAEIPRDAYAEIEKGLQEARQAVRDPANFEAVSEYIESIQYRINYHSWPLAEIHETTNRFMNQVATFELADQSQITATRVLELLQQNELRLLGLDPDYIPSSQIETRIRVLNYWSLMKKINAFKTLDMDSKESSYIKHFFRFFALMANLKQRMSPQGQALQFNEPTIYQHKELIHPYAEILKKRRIYLIALPGNPPAPESIALLESTIEEREWLAENANYAFVVLFIPNATEDIKKRLKRNFSNWGLVIIDEQSLLEICLTLNINQTAVSRLRPLLLNSLDIRDLAIFQVNQACHPDTSIFVGRTYLVKRVVNSHINYAIYGGRRIGKTSILHAIRDSLDSQGVLTILYSFEGKDASDAGTVRNFAELLNLEDINESVDKFNLSLQKKLNNDPELRVVFLLDEIDRYIVANPDRHQFIECIRDISDQNGGRFRVIMAGFMDFFHCLNGHGPYSPSSDPWRRMVDDGPLGNLRASSAEKIVREGFMNILGWEFEHPMIPERIVLKTGGHPSFVQYFCKKIQELVGKRKGRIVNLADIEAVFADSDPTYSFIAHVRKTLELNLKPVERFLIVWLAAMSSDTITFTLDEINEIFESANVEVSPNQLKLALKQLEVTSVVKAKAEGFYEFSVPDYPYILDRLGDTKHLDELERELKIHLAKNQSRGDVAGDGESNDT